MLSHKVRKWVEMNKAYPYPTIEEPQENEVYDCFYKNLEYTPYGMKGRMGLGGNRMNYVVVAKAMQGLVNYHLKKIKTPLKSVVLAYDTSHYTKSLAMTAASVLAANGVKVHLFEESVPVPLMAFVTKEIMADVGVMFSGRHHMADYCGFKINYPNVTVMEDTMAKELSVFMGMVDPLYGVRYLDFKEGLSNMAICHVETTYFEKYVQYASAEVLREIELRVGTLQEFEGSEKQIKVAYTPYHGTGRQLLEDLFRANGFSNLFTVESEAPPVSSLTLGEMAGLVSKNVFKKSLDVGRAVGADLILATDMTGTRFTAMVLHGGSYKVLKSHEISDLLKDFMTWGDEEHLKPTVKTYDESVVSWMGDYPVEKDGIAGALMLAIMAEHQLQRGLTLYDALERLRNRHGHHVTAVRYIELSGEEGYHRIEHTMGFFRFCSPTLLGQQVVKTDYRFGFEEHPPVNMVKLNWSDIDWVAVRPSLFEAKLEFYFSAWGENNEAAASKLQSILDKVAEILPGSVASEAISLHEKDEL